MSELKGVQSRWSSVTFSHVGEQGWRSGESARLPPMCPGFDSRTRCHMWVEFVVSSLLCSERFFSGYSGFLLSSKTNISKFQFDPDVRHFSHEPLAWVIVQALPVLDVKFALAFYLTVLWPLTQSPLKTRKYEDGSLLTEEHQRNNKL